MRAAKWVRLLTEALALGLVVLVLAGVALGWRLCAVLSGSMEPTLPVGSLLLILPEQSPRPGQILTFASGDSLVTHRAVAQNPDGTLVTKGDANAQNDPQPLSTALVQGRVVLCVPGLGWAAIALSRPLARALAVGAAGALALAALWPTSKKVPQGQHRTIPDRRCAKQAGSRGSAQARKENAHEAI